MRFKFKNKKLEELYTEEKNAHKYPHEVVDRFLKVIFIIDGMPDEQYLYKVKGLRFEKLKGERGKKGQHSIRLNKQWRLILTIEKDADGNFILVIEIEDYH
ncbi:MAG: type II toxin-antitoxin system RelE/ParE family toxin [Gomphosphaeria aponina SAG 52.96 = DSM 107014]|uniref:Type II toxin-antitoxin system RelE/ParE family toxin n=1 Tax=Gomphosphaeria aponina SAG 52.96 = DSM 107014 TaxID=1521640 RepID=A0A941JQM1_9CHRO|nr:type II toxin-antitoxin system RelE/ParE family toxin [Gomphosphaeria aponina SAG 52.96 = DSM 107014]